MSKEKEDKKKNKKKELEESGENIFSYLQKETVQGILAILFLVLSIFFTLSGFNKAGSVGGMIYPFFTYLFGIGYWLLPILLLILCLSFFNSIKKRLALTHSIGGLLFFVSS